LPRKPGCDRPLFYSINDGTTHVIFEPLDFIARLVALVPRPRVNLTRYYGVFAPHSQYRALVTPAMGSSKKSESDDNQTPAEHRASMTWAQRLKRVFNIDIETCGECHRRLQTLSDQTTGCWHPVCCPKEKNCFPNTIVSPGT